MLKAPHRPRLAVMTNSSVRLPERVSKWGHFDTSTPLAPISPMRERRLSRYGPDDCTRCWADFSFAVATISMVRVIFFVEATLLIRLRMTFGCSGMLPGLG